MHFWPRMSTDWGKTTWRGFPSSPLLASLCTSQGNPCLALIETKFHEEYFKRFDFHFQWGDGVISAPKSCVAQSDKKLREGVDDNLEKFQNLQIFLTTGAYISFLYFWSGKKSTEGVDDNLYKFQNLKIFLTTGAHISFYIFNLAKSQEREWRTTCKS